MSTNRLTVPEVCSMFGVTQLTLLNWRKGTKRRPPLPTLKPLKSEPPNAVRFSQSQALQWAKKNGVELAAPEPKVAAKSARRGPKSKPAE